MDEFSRIDRATWRRYLFYIDLAVFAVFAISLVVLVRQTYRAGAAHGDGLLRALSDELWGVATVVAFLVGSLSYIAYRFFRNEYLVLTRRF